MFTVEQLREIRAAMTWGDQAYGKAEAGDDAQELIKYAMHRAAKRLQLVAAESTLEEFLDLVTMDTMSEALSEDRSPTSAATET